MSNLTRTNTTTKTRFLTKKEFGQYQKLKCRKAIRRRYETYLIALGKPVTLRLTNYDIFLIDGINL